MRFHPYFKIIIPICLFLISNCKPKIRNNISYANIQNNFNKVENKNEEDKKTIEVFGLTENDSVKVLLDKLDDTKTVGLCRLGRQNRALAEALDGLQQICIDKKGKLTVANQRAEKACYVVYILASPEDPENPFLMGYQDRDREIPVSSLVSILERNQSFHYFGGTQICVNGNSDIIRFNFKKKYSLDHIGFENFIYALNKQGLKLEERSNNSGFNLTFGGFVKKIFDSNKVKNRANINIKETETDGVVKSYQVSNSSVEKTIYVQKSNTLRGEAAAKAKELNQGTGYGQIHLYSRVNDKDLLEAERAFNTKNKEFEDALKGEEKKYGELWELEDQINGLYKEKKNVSEDNYTQEKLNEKLTKINTEITNKETEFKNKKTEYQKKFDYDTIKKLNKEVLAAKDKYTRLDEMKKNELLSQDEQISRVIDALYFDKYFGPGKQLETYWKTNIQKKYANVNDIGGESEFKVWLNKTVKSWLELARGESITIHITATKGGKTVEALNLFSILFKPFD